MKETFTNKVNRIIDETLENGSFQGKDFVISVKDQENDKHQISVREISTNKLFAFSAMQADFNQSLYEFVTDYII